MQKWKDMVQYGLDADSVTKVFVKYNVKEPLEFTSFAIIGLQNFYNCHP